MPKDTATYVTSPTATYVTSPTATFSKDRIKNILHEFDSKTKSSREKRDPKLSLRLHTFKIWTWFGKPLELSPKICAERGWTNSGIDELYCMECKAKLLVPISIDSANISNMKELVEKLGKEHEESCFWRGHIPLPARFQPLTRCDIVVSTLTNPRSVVLERIAKWNSFLESEKINIPSCYIDHLDSFYSVFHAVEGEKDILALSLANWTPTKLGCKCEECGRECIWELFQENVFHVVQEHKVFCRLRDADYSENWTALLPFGYAKN